MNKFQSIYEFLCGEIAYEEREKELWGSNKLTDKQIGRIAKRLRICGFEVPDDIPGDYIYNGSNSWIHETYKGLGVHPNIHPDLLNGKYKEYLDNLPNAL